ncbi:MAG: hypothetical protein JXA77_10015 [Bacteroidales bacterium]|nr:hypothetical protein [Bacteroidales bacterium]MBN2818318.1 hypothetical protein [Bacteroidales bacterium]
MELCVFINNSEHLDNQLQSMDIVGKPGPEYVQMMDSDVKVNQTALSILKKYYDLQLGQYYKDYISRIYFGNETCEYLIPALGEVQKVFKYCADNEYGFTYVAPYTGPNGMEKLRDIFEFLKDKEDVEVVVNDFGVLQLILTEFKSIKPIIGRLLVKTKRDPRFSVTGYDYSPNQLKNTSKVEKNQTEAIMSSSFENKTLQKFLIDKGVTRISLDSLPQGYEKKTLKGWQLPADIFWPWTYITSGRLCAIAAHTDTRRKYNLVDRPCNKQCRMYEFNFESDKQMLQTVQRGNAVWMDNESNYLENFKAGFERLVFMPYIPI